MSSAGRAGNRHAGQPRRRHACRYDRRAPSTTRADAARHHLPIASVTKPITAVAAMILVEECRLRLDDPVDRWLPELADRQVLTHLESPLDDTVPANRPITVRDLLTFRAGYGAIFSAHHYPSSRRYRGRRSRPAGLRRRADELMQALRPAAAPHQPGERWLYNSGSDILGVLIARATGRASVTSCQSGSSTRSA